MYYKLLTLSNILIVSLQQRIVARAGASFSGKNNYLHLSASLTVSIEKDLNAFFSVLDSLQCYLCGRRVSRTSTRYKSGKQGKRNDYSNDAEV